MPQFIEFIEDEDHTIVDDMEWRKHAACSGLDTQWWFAEHNPKANAYARKVCGACPVREDCLEFALNNNIRFGLWGGVPESKRSRIRGARKREARRG
jgi:WhiB family redox-sensing transcriptional regulator